MRTRVSDDIVLGFKDHLRNVRYLIRRQARGGPVDLPVPGPVAAATDAMFDSVQAAATALLPKDEVALYAFPFPQDVAAYFAPDRQDPDALTPKVYAALKSALRGFGSDVFLVSEQAVQEASSRARASGARALVAALDAGRPPGERYEAAVRVCAGLAAALAAAKPIRQVFGSLDRRGRPRASGLAPNEYCAFVVGLGIALASRADVAGQPRASLEEAADLAVNARLGELSKALTAPEPTAALAAEFTDLLRFLP